MHGASNKKASIIRMVEKKDNVKWIKGGFSFPGFFRNILFFRHIISSSEFESELK